MISKGLSLKMSLFNKLVKKFIKRSELSLAEYAEYSHMIREDRALI